ncbi:MAG: hypothetical protein WCD37_06090 [Chloroflexia bacterium]
MIGSTPQAFALEKDVDLCALLKQLAGSDEAVLFPGINDPLKATTCQLNYRERDPNKKLDSIRIERRSSPASAQSFVTDAYQRGKDTLPWVATSVFGDPGFGYEISEHPDAISPEITRGLGIRYARGCYEVIGDAGQDSDDAKKPRDPGPLRAMASAIDRELQEASCGAPPPPTATATPIKKGEVNLTVDHIEVVQVVQTQDNKIPLVAGKRTVVRVFVKAEDQTEQIGVKASLFIWPEGKTEVEVKGGKLLALNPGITPGRGEAESSINFLLPPETTAAGVFSLKAVVNPDHSVKERDYSDNDHTEPFEFMQRNSLRIGYVKIGYKPPGKEDFEWPGPNVGKYEALLKKTYPVADAGLQYYELPWRVRVVGDLNSGGNLLLDLRELYERIDKDRPDLIVGWLPANDLGSSNRYDFGGVGYIGEPASVAVDYRSEFEVSEASVIAMTHEVGHNLGLDHPGTTGDPSRDCSIAKNWFGNAEYWPSEYGNSAAIHEVGFDTQLMEVIPPTYYDYMSYCHKDRWISPFHYKKLYDGNLRPRGETANLGKAKVWVRGSIIFGKVINFEMVRPPDDSSGGSGPSSQASGKSLLPSLADLQLSLMGQSKSVAAQREGTGDYCLRFMNAGGALLYENCFDPPQLYSARTGAITDEVGFVLALPDPGKAASVVLVRNESGQEELTSLKVSAHAPTVAITAPKAGDRWEGEHTIEWTGSDEDGDALRYDIMYSADGKQSWYPLEIGNRDTQYTFSTEEILPSEQTYIRILASDGYNTTAADVGPFVVPSQPNSPKPPPPPLTGSDAVAGAGSTSAPGGALDSSLLFIIGGGALLVVGASLGAFLVMRFGRRRAVAQAVPPPYAMPPYPNTPQYPPQQYPPAQYPPQQMPPYQGYAPVPPQPLPRRGSKAPLVLLLLLVVIGGGLAAGFLFMGWKLPAFGNNSSPSNVGVTQPTTQPTSTRIVVAEPTLVPEIIPTTPPDTPTVVTASSDTRRFELSLEDIPVDGPVISDVIEGTDGLQLHLRLQARLYEDPNGEGVSRQPVVIVIALEDAAENTSVDMWLVSSQQMVNEFTELLGSASSTPIEVAQEGESYEVISPEGWVLKVTVNSMSLDEDAELTDGLASPYPVFAELELGVELIPK